MGENSFCSLTFKLFSFEDLNLEIQDYKKRCSKEVSLNSVPVKINMKDHHGRKLQVSHCYGMNSPKIMQFLKIIDYDLEIIQIKIQRVTILLIWVLMFLSFFLFFCLLIGWFGFLFAILGSVGFFVVFSFASRTETLLRVKSLYTLRV